MNGIEKITARISQDAEAELSRLNEQTQTEIQEIQAKAQAQADKLTADILSRGDKAAADRQERLISAAHMEWRKLELATKQGALAKAFQMAQDQLVSLPDDKYIALLTQLVKKASSTGKEALIFSPKDRSRVGKQVVVAANEAIKNGQLTLSEETRPIQGGFILSDGDVEVNCAFNTLVRLQREVLEKDVAKLLFD